MVDKSDTGVSSGQSVAAQQHGGPDVLSRIWFAEGAGMTDNQVFLQVGRLLFRDKDIGKLTETGSQSVDDSAFLQLSFNVVSRFVHSRLCFRCDFYFFVAAANADDLFYSQVFSVDNNCHNNLSNLF